MCKGNYVRHVKGKMFFGLPKDMELQSVPCFYVFTDHGTPESSIRKELDLFSREDVIIVTQRHASFFPKTATASPGRRAQPQSRRRHRRVISAKRVFRSRRFCADQVRDVAASATRGTARERSCSILWLFPAFVLSGTSRFPRGWLGRITASQTRTTRRPQVNSRSDGSRQSGPGTGYVLVLGGDRQAHSGAVSDFHSPAQYRSSVEPSKKTQLSVDEATDCGQHAELSTAYEQLRGQVLGVYGKPPRGPGLAVFLERGMKAWIVAYRQWSALTAASKTARSPLSTTLRAPVQNDVIVLLTGMLLERTVQEGR